MDAPRGSPQNPPSSSYVGTKGSIFAAQQYTRVQRALESAMKNIDTSWMFEPEDVMARVSTGIARVGYDTIAQLSDQDLYTRIYRLVFMEALVSSLIGFTDDEMNRVRGVLIDIARARATQPIS